MNTQTVSQVLHSTIERLKRGGVKESENISEIIFRKILNVSRSDLFLKNQEVFAENLELVLNHYIERILKGEPVQYVIGETEFYGLKIFCDKNTLIPRPETEVLVESVLKDSAIKSPSAILDIGTGTGCIAVALAKFGGHDITAVDISSETLKLAERNSIYNQVDDRIKFMKADIFSDDFDMVINREFDIIVSNPPYVSWKEMSGLDKLIIDNEPESALTDFKDGLEFYRRYAEVIPRLCRDKTLVFLEIAENRAEIIADTFSHILNKIEIIHDLAGKPRVLKGCFLK